MRHFLISSNKKCFDLVRALHDLNVIDWQIGGHIRPKVGDVIFFYMGEPYGQILYKFEVEAIDLPDTEVNQLLQYRPRGFKPFNGPWSRLKAIDFSPWGYKPLQPAALIREGINTFYHPQSLTPEIAAYISEHFIKSKE